jgi:hypothetical protein
MTAPKPWPYYANRAREDALAESQTILFKVGRIQDQLSSPRGPNWDAIQVLAAQIGQAAAMIGKRLTEVGGGDTDDLTELIDARIAEKLREVMQ